MGTKVYVPPFKDPQLLNFAKQIQDALGSGTGTQTGNGRPKVKNSDKQGDTYWNSTDNNFWIFMNGQWMQLDGGLKADLKTGKVVRSLTGEFYGWYYRYLTIRYADDVNADDYNVYSVTGFSKDPTNKKWYGTYNFDDNTVDTEDPTKYSWSNANIPNNTFGTLNFYFYETKGGRRYAYSINKVNGQPDGNYTTAPTGIIDLDVITSALGPVAVTGEQVIRYANNIIGTLDYSTSPTNRQFIGYWAKSAWDAASAQQKENPDNYTWKALGAVVGPMDKVFAAAGQNGSITFAVGLMGVSPDATKYSDLTYSVSATTGATFDPGMRSGYVVTQLVAQSGGGGIGYTNTESPVAGAGAVNISLPFVGQQGTYDTRTYPFITVDQYGRVAGLAQTNSTVEYFLASKKFQTFATGVNTVILDHVPGQVLVYLNGILLTPTTDYTEAAAVSGISPSITIPSWTSGNVTVYRFRKVMGFFEQTDQSPFTRQDTTLSMDATQVALPSGVAAQTEILFVNGAQLPDSEYSYTTMGGVTYATLITGEVIPAGSTVTIIAFALVNTVPKFNQSALTSVANQSMYTFMYAPRPNNIIPSPLTYVLANTIGGVLVDETTTSPAFTGDYTWPVGSKTETLTSASPTSGVPLQYTVWVSDLAYT